MTTFISSKKFAEQFYEINCVDFAQAEKQTITTYVKKYFMSVKG